MALNAKEKKSKLKEDAYIYEKREEGLTGKQRWKTLSPKEKRLQFKDYYLRPLLITLAVVVVASYFLYHDFILRKEVIYQSAIINEAILQDSLDSFSQNFVSFINQNSEKKRTNFQTFFLDSELATSVGTTAASDIQQISAQIYSQTLDSLIIGKDTFPVYFEKGMYLDLDTVLTPKEINALADYLYIPDDTSLNPSGKPYGIELEKSPVYQSLFQKEQEHWVDTPVLTIISNSERKEISRELIYYLFPNVLQK